MDLNQFADLMEKRARVVPQRVLEIKKQVAGTVIEMVANSTPVDTGTAISNWQVNLGSAARGSVLAKVPGMKGSTGTANREATIAQGRSVIAGAGAGVDIHITNNLYYIEELNRGTSSQAPAGFVEQAAIAASMTIKNAKVIVS